MQKRLLNLSVYIFLCNLSFAQQPVTSFAPDSAWYAGYFERVTALRESLQASAYDSLELVKELAERTRFPAAVSSYHFHKASWFIANKNADSAILNFKAAIIIAEQGKFIREAGTAYLGLANYYQFNGNTLDAAVNYIQAAKLLKEKGRKRTLIGIYRNLYTVLTRLKQKNEALQNMLSAVVADNSNETDLVEIINTKSNEAWGLNFPDQSLIKEVGADAIYVIFGNAKFIVDFKTLGSYGSFRDIQRIPAGALSLIPDFPRNGSILMEFSGDPKVYIAKDNQLYHITGTEVLEHYGSWDAVYFVPSGSLKKFPKSTQLVTLDNVNTIFNLSQAFDVLTDSIKAALIQNKSLSNELSRSVAERNSALQKRKTWLWVSAVGLIALLLIVILLIRNFRQKQKINEQSLLNLKAEQYLQHKMELEKERTRIATDMHDDLGAGLSTIRFLSEKVKRNSFSDATKADAEKIVNNSNELLQKMNELIWAMNEKNDTLEDLLFYTRSYAADYCEANNLQVHISMPTNIPDLIVNGEFRRNVFLCVKESLHNIIKHAAANNVAIQFETNTHLNISIADDGKGFPEQGKHTGNGLRNMKMRMEMLGGKFEVRDKNGVSVVMKLPLPVK